MSFPQVISQLLLQNFGDHSVKSRLRPPMDIPSLLHFLGRFRQHDIYEELDLRGLLDHNLFVCWPEDFDGNFCNFKSCSEVTNQSI